jgi:hypothetical protein
MWTAHPEDDSHWRHWDKQTPEGKETRVPSNSKKPRANEKKLPKDRCETDPNGNAPEWKPVSSSQRSVPNPMIPVIPVPSYVPVMPSIPILGPQPVLVFP